MRVGEEVPQDLHVHRRPGADRRAKRMAVLRRDGGTGDKPFVCRLFLQGIQEEFGRAFHRGINALQDLLVPAEFVAIPEMQAQPGAAGRPHAPVWPVNRR